MLLILTISLILGCQNNDVSNQGNTTSIKVNDINEINILQEQSSYPISSHQEKIEFINAVNNGVYNHGKLDIRPSDYTVNITLVNGEIRGFSFWVIDGADLFIDHSRAGHYKLNEKDRLKILEIISNTIERAVSEK